MIWFEIVIVGIAVAILAVATCLVITMTPAYQTRKLLKSADTNQVDDTFRVTDKEHQ